MFDECIENDFIEKIKVASNINNISCYIATFRIIDNDNDVPFIMLCILYNS